MHMNSHVFDNRSLYSSTSTTVYQFALDILEFCRISHLLDKQRIHLLELFQKHLPSPNLMPKSNDELLGAVGIGKLYQSEKICGVCYSSTTNAICSTAGCTHEEMKVSSDDIVEVISMDLTEQLKVLINKNIGLLLQKYQDQARAKTMSDSQDIVRDDVYQYNLSTEKDFFVSVMIHNDGIPL